MPGTPPLRSFRESPWRYSQFVIVGLVIGGLVKWLGGLGWIPAMAVGAAVAVAYLLLEKRRGVI